MAALEPYYLEPNMLQTPKMIAVKIAKRIIAFMHDEIIPAKITTKPWFENRNFRFFHELIPRAVMVKRIPT